MEKDKQNDEISSKEALINKIRARTKNADPRFVSFMSSIATFERPLYEARLRYPIIYHIVMANFAFTAFVTGAIFRRRGYPATATLCSVGAGLLVGIGYYRSISPAFRDNFALPPRIEGMESKDESIDKKVKYEPKPLSSQEMKEILKELNQQKESNENEDQ